jgi:hypothetical protein
MKAHVQWSNEHITTFFWFWQEEETRQHHSSTVYLWLRRWQNTEPPQKKTVFAFAADVVGCPTRQHPDSRLDPIRQPV